MPKWSSSWSVRFPDWHASGSIKKRKAPGGFQMGAISTISSNIGGGGGSLVPRQLGFAEPVCFICSWTWSTKRLMTPTCLQKKKDGWSSYNVTSTSYQRSLVLINSILNSINGCRDTEQGWQWTGWPVCNAFDSFRLALIVSLSHPSTLRFFPPGNPSNTSSTCR